jgi:hypothetical protein
MSVEEISAKLRETQPQPRLQEANQVPAEPATVTEPGADELVPGVEVPVSGELQTQAGEAAAKDEPVVPAPTPLPERLAKIPAAPVEPAVPLRPPVETAAEDSSSKASLEPADHASVEVTLPEPKVQPPEPATAVAPSSDVAAVGADGTVGESEEPLAPGMTLPPGGGDARNLYLSAGVGLLVLAIGILWWRVRRPRGHGRASVISQSMHRR